MVLPVWAGATFFPTFWPDGAHAASFVTKIVFINPCFECGPLVSGSSMRGFKAYRTAVIAVDFRKATGEGKMFCLKGSCNVCRG